jgi:PAS domain-containing protein
VSRHAYLLVHLDAVHEPRRSVLNSSDDLFDRLDNLPMGLVITDGALCVEFANREFLDLTGVPSRDAAEGKSLLRWLDLTQDHLDQLHRQMQLRQAATVMTTSSSTWYGPGPSFEVIAVAVPDTASQNWGFVLRQLSRQPLPGCGFRSHDDSGAGRF